MNLTVEPSQPAVMQATAPAGAPAEAAEAAVWPPKLGVRDARYSRSEILLHAGMRLPYGDGGDFGDPAAEAPWALNPQEWLGRDILIQGDRLSIHQGLGRGSIQLVGPADRIDIEIMALGERIVDIFRWVSAGPGRCHFKWPAGRHVDSEGLRFRVYAALKGRPVPCTPLMRDRLLALRTDADIPLVTLAFSGTVPLAVVKSPA